MYGPPGVPGTDPEAGIVPRAAQMIFELIRAASNNQCELLEVLKPLCDQLNCLQV